MRRNHRGYNPDIVAFICIAITINVTVICATIAWWAFNNG
jgi:hypothetical protein